MLSKIIIIIIGFALGTCFGIALENKSHILAVLTAIGTVGAVIWVVAKDTILKYIDRPKLDVNFYETDAPYLRYVPPDHRNQPHQHILTLYISNIGRSVAEACQPLITKLWIKDIGDESWIFPEGWVPLPLNWVFASELQQEYLDERNIIPNKPYLFNICTFFHNNSFVLTAPIHSRSRPRAFPGQRTYCIELTLFSINAKPVEKYYYIEWKGPFELELSSFEKNIEIFESKNPPRSFRSEKIDGS